MKFIDIFAGIGGFRLGFEQEGYECVFSSEINQNCQEVYKNNFGEMPFSDITKIKPDDIPNFDVLIGGFPCQPFSISGKKLGFEDTRGTLFFDICNILKIKQPKIVVLENVKHFIHHDKKRTLNVVLKSLANLGYKVNYKILNSKDFGVPQNRERIFIIGNKDYYFDFYKLNKTKSLPLKYFLDKAGDFKILPKEEYTLIKQPRKQPSGLIFVGYRNKNTWKIGIRPNTKHLSRVHRQPNRIYSVEGYHPTIPSQETSGRFFIYLPEKNIVRKLTINECYKIMGFPDDFIKHESLAECYKQVGNSVCVPLVNEIAKSIKYQEGLLDDYELFTNTREDLQLLPLGF